MSYTDTSFTVQNGYSAIHSKQVYDQFATQLGAHSAWSFIEQVDYVTGSTTVSTYVWKCSSAVSGLSADFYIGLQVVAVSGLYTTAYTASGVLPALNLVMFEAYNSSTHTASRIATYPVNSSQTTGSLGENTSTWVLSAARPQGQPNLVTWAPCGPGQASTGGRLLLTVTPTGIKGGYKDSGTTPIMYQFYAGAFDSIMNSTDEPLPLVLIGGFSSSTGTFNQNGVMGSTTRHPKRASYTGSYLFGVATNYGFNNTSPSSLSSTYLGGAPVLAINYTTNANTSGAAAGQLGNSADTQVSLFTGTVPVSRCSFAHYSLFGGNGATLGGVRGYLKDWLSCTTIAHSFGDTFSIDSKTYVGFGVQYGAGVMDTTA